MKVTCTYIYEITTIFNGGKKSVESEILLVKDKKIRIGYLKETISKIFDTNFC